MPKYLIGLKWSIYIFKKSQEVSAVIFCCSGNQRNNNKSQIACPRVKNEWSNYTEQNFLVDILDFQYINIFVVVISKWLILTCTRALKLKS